MSSNEGSAALVLSGGGVAGGAWMLGALEAIVAETGWNPATAGHLLGTSAGAVIATMLAAGESPARMAAYARDEVPGGGVRRSFGAELKLHWTFPRPVLGSPGLAWRSLREPWRYGPAGIVAWLPQGVISTQPIRDVIKSVVPSGWTDHPNLWIVAVDYETGERVVFGREDGPRAALDAAVAASCAVPGFYHPVAIRGHRYIDGGLYSPANLDELAGCEARTVICLSPMTSPHQGGLFEPTGAIATVVRGGGRARLLRDKALLEAEGKTVLLLEPGPEDLRVLGYNYMSGRRRLQVMASSLRNTTTALRGTPLGRALSSLAAGAAVAASASGA